MLPKEITTHIKALDQWLDQLNQISAPPRGLSAKELKQLQAVNKAVENLQRNNIPVPEDLRRLKLELSARDVTGYQNQEVEKQLNAVETVIRALGKTIQNARSHRERLKTTRPAGGKKKNYGVSLLDLIQDGLLSPDDHLELQWLKNGPVHKGKVMDDGKVMLKTPDGWKAYNSLSTAASQMAERSLNGWTHWRRVNSDGTTTSFEDIRSQYIQKGMAR
jgi:hypothetical protein